MDIQATGEKLLKDLRDAEAIVISRQTHSRAFEILIRESRRTARVGSEGVRILGTETPLEGCFLAVLADIPEVETAPADFDWQDALEKCRAALEFHLNSPDKSA